MTTGFADKIRDTVKRAIDAEKARIVHEETEKCMNGVRRRLAAAAAQVVTQIACQYTAENERYTLSIDLPASGIAGQALPLADSMPQPASRNACPTDQEP